MQSEASRQFPPLNFNGKHPREEVNRVRADSVRFLTAVPSHPFSLCRDDTERFHFAENIFIPFRHFAKSSLRIGKRTGETEASSRAEIQSFAAILWKRLSRSPLSDRESRRLVSFRDPVSKFYSRVIE